MGEVFKHSFKDAQRASLSLVVYNVGFQKCLPGYGWGPGVRDHYLVHYVVSGHGKLSIENRTYVLQAGNAFLIQPDVPVFYQADENDPWEYYWVGFSGSNAPLLLAQTGFAAASPVITLPNGEQLRQSLLDIYKARGSDYSSAVRMSGYLQAALGLLIKHAPPPKGDEGLAAYARLGAVYIHQNYFRPVTVQEIAEQVGVSRSYLYRAFSSAYGCSPSGYLAQFRIQRACQLLRYSALPVSAVAISTGFEDHFYFSRVFHRIMGISPSQYRKQADQS